MSISWSRRVEGEYTILDGIDSSGFRAAVCAVNPRQDMQRYLMPVRVAESELGGSDGFARSIVSHTAGLGEKIRGIDNLCLSDCRFSDGFGAARMVVIGAAGASEGIWRFAKAAVQDLQAHLAVPAVSQIDYDQKRLHTNLGASLDSIDFAVRHDPSAIATVEAYLAVLRFKGVCAGDASFSVTGVGDLGGRLVRRLLEMGAAEVVIADRDAARMQQLAAMERVRTAPLHRVAFEACHAHILSADKSFDGAVAEAWAGNPVTLAVGGPEAGIDRFMDARKELAAKQKEFVPSVLCGSLGLVSNLEEALGIAPDLNIMTLRFQRLMKILLARMEAHCASLADTCEGVLLGSKPLGSMEARFVARGAD